MRMSYINALIAPELDNEYVIGIVPRSWLKYVLGAMEVRKSHWLYNTPEDAKQAFAVLSEVQMSFLIDAYNGLTLPVDRVYRLIDTTLNAAEYTSSVVGGVIVYDPVIPAVPVLSVNSLLTRSQVLFAVVNDALNGSTIYEPTSIRDGVRDILEAIRDNVLDDDADIATILSDLTSILALLA